MLIKHGHMDLNVKWKKSNKKPMIGTITWKTKGKAEKRSKDTPPT
jgi:hypothetical protein